MTETSQAKASVLLWFGVLSGVTACGGDDSVIIQIAADEPLRASMNSFCLGVADDDESQGEFGQTHWLGPDALQLPQTLAVAPGDARTAHAWARGYRSGIEVARSRASFVFDGDQVELALASCSEVAATNIAPQDSYGLPSDSQLAIGYGREGAWIVAMTASEAIAILAENGSVAPGGITIDREPVFTTAPRAMIAGDIDGDCDDDIVVLEANQPPSIWIRRVRELAWASDRTPASAGVAKGAAAGDLDNDGDLDLVMAGSSGVSIWENNEASFTVKTLLDSAAGAVDAMAVELMLANDDGVLDLVVMRGSIAVAEPLLFLGVGDLSFSRQTGVFTGPLLGRAAAAADLNGDGLDDLVMGGSAAPLSVFINQGGTLVPTTEAIPTTANLEVVDLVATDVDGDCIPDLAIAQQTANALVWKGTGVGGFVLGQDLGDVARRVLADDVDVDAKVDVFSQSQGSLTWYAR